MVEDFLSPKLMIQDDGTRARQTIRRRYILALSIITMLSLSGFLIMEYNLRQHESRSLFLDYGGRQRMLSQQISLFASQLALQSDPSLLDLTRRRMKHVIDEFEHMHQSLLEGNEALNLPKEVSEDARRIYFEEPINLDLHVKNYISHARNLLVFSYSLSAPEEIYAHSSYQFIIENGPNSLLSGLQKVVEQYRQEDDDELHVIMRIEGAIILLVILTLALEVKFIFRPMMRSVGLIYHELAEINRMKSDFIANMSHEIRTPLNAIFGTVELLQESRMDAQQQRYAQRVMNAADELMNLLDDILDFSKIEAGKLVLESVEFDLQATIDDVAALLSEQVRGRNLELIVHAHPDTPRYVQGDPGRLRQIIMNLVSNGLKFTHEGYVLIHIMRAEEQPDPDKVMIVFEVEDTGIGIEPTKYAQIFEQFSQADTSTTRRYGGLGLGLTIVQQLTRLMGGTLSLNSELGKGSAFRVLIPMSSSERTESYESQHVLLNGLRGLIVDDVRANRLLLAEQLRMVGMETRSAESADTGMKLLRDSYNSGLPFDLVISDYMMPNKDGIMFTREIKQDQLLQAVPVVMLSSVGNQIDTSLFREAGVSAYLMKPVRAKQLFDALALIWRQKRQIDASQFITEELVEDDRYQHLKQMEKPLRGTKILLVDDNRTNRALAEEMLLAMGCEVQMAEHGGEAVELVKQQPFDLVLMDCQMPIMDGFEATERINQLISNHTIGEVPVIALTANAMKGDKERCLKAGMQDYMSKPIRKQKLEAVLFKWLEHRMQQEKQLVAAKIATPLPDSIATVVPETSLPSLTTKSTDLLIDHAALEETQEVLGERFHSILMYYLEDIPIYLREIEKGLQLGNAQQIMAAAHTIKSSSQQYGVLRLYELGKLAEHCAKDQQLDQLQELYEALKAAFEEVSPELEKIAQQKAA